MDLVTFALWKSREIEQRVDGAHASELLKTRIERPRDRYFVEYDIEKDTAKIYNAEDPDKFVGPFPIRDTLAQLKRMKLYLGNL